MDTVGVPVTRRTGTTGRIVISQDDEKADRLYLNCPRHSSITCDEAWDLIENLTRQAETLWDN